MRYNSPFGRTDPEASFGSEPYVNGDPSIGRAGSIPPAASIEYDQREIVAVIKYAHDEGLLDYNGDACAAASNSDLTQLLKAIFGISRKGVEASLSFFNVKQFATSTRVFMQGRTGNSWTVTPWSPGNYIKKSATSDLLFWGSFPTYTPRSPEDGGGFVGVGSSTAFITIGSDLVRFMACNNIRGESRGQSNVCGKLSGVSVGSKAVSVSFTGGNSADWDGTFCPTTTDSPFLAASMNSQILIAEVEPA